MSKAGSGGERVDGDVLEAAFDAARRDGLSFAEWMSRRLAEHQLRSEGPRRGPIRREPGRETDEPAGAAPSSGPRLTMTHDEIAQLAGKLDDMRRGVESEHARTREAARIETGASREAGFPARPRQIPPRLPAAGAHAPDPRPDGRALDDAMKRLEARLDALAEKADETLCAAFEKYRSALSEQIADAHQRMAERMDEGAAAASRNLDDLRDFVGALLREGEAEPRAPAIRIAVEALARDLSGIHGRLDRADENFAGLRSLEPAIAGMAGRIEETRRLAAEAAEAANRAASQDHLWGAAARELEQRLAREIADLRVFQDESDRRANLSANAAQEKAGQFADRLAKLEASLGEARSGQAGFGPALSPGSGRPQGLASSRDGIDAIRIGEAAKDLNAKDLAAKNLAAEPPDQDSKADIDESEDILIEPGGGFPKGRQKRGAGGAAPVISRSETGQSDFIVAAQGAAEAARLEGGERLASGTRRASGDDAAGGEPPSPNVGLFGARKHQMILGIIALLAGLGAFVSIGAVRPLDQFATTTMEVVLQRLFSAEKAAADEGRVVAQDAPPLAPQSVPGLSGAFDARLLDPRPLGRQGLEATETLGVIEPWRLSAKNAASPAGETGRGEDIAGAALAKAETPAAIERPADASADFQRGAAIAVSPQGPHDMKRAAQWFEAAARRGSAAAQYRLGILFERGSGVVRDPARAKALYLAAAEQGHARAMHNLGVLAAEGTNGRPDYASAAAWFAKAAQYGVRDSQFNIAVLLARGLGAPQDAGRAYMWFAILAAQGDAEADRRAQDLAARLTGAELAEARTAAAAFRPQKSDVAGKEDAAPVSRVKPQVSGL